MATHSSVLAWKIPWTESLDGGSWWAAIYGVAQNRTQLKRPSSNSSPMLLTVILWIAACQASLSFTITQSLLKLMFIESVMPSKLLIFCSPLLPSSIFPSIRVFSKESALHFCWPKYWTFCFSISPSSEYSGLISFRID